MEEISISLQNVSKKYRLFNSPQERLKEALHPFNKKYHREFWALKDISLEVKKGSTIGIVGRNGSGKSTLLHIICSILKPTTGTVAVKAKISSLLALGSGYNFEFTGRQNVLLNAAIIGLSREEIKIRMPEIEAFADIGEFIDQPMKIYSSGMFLRLAFAAAINVEPDILVIDEVLAVGDAKFQHKCYQKFIDLQNKGTTIVLVTHDSSVIVKHCDYAILLEKGKIIERGDPKLIDNCYSDLLFGSQKSEYVAVPELIEENYHGFNILRYRKKYIALSLSLGSFDLTQVEEETLNEYANVDKYVSGISLKEVKQLVDQLICKNQPANIHLAIANDKFNNKERDPLQDALSQFIEHNANFDNSVNRRSYNKNEYRYGDRKAEIVDYMIISSDSYDPAVIKSGDKINIYVKVKFNSNIDFPVFGFAIKTIDGVTVYGSNTSFQNNTIPSVGKSEIIIFHLFINMSVNAGDYFLHIGMGEEKQGMHQIVDSRADFIHLKIVEEQYYDGFVKLESKIEEFYRSRLLNN